MSNDKALTPIENCMLFDWYSCTFPEISDPNQIVDLLSFNNKVVFSDNYGIRGYSHRLYFDGIHVFYGHKVNRGCWLEMSGQGCRTFETFSDIPGGVLGLIRKVNPLAHHVSRLDVAFDDHEGLFDIDKMYRDADKGNFVAKAKKEPHLHKQGKACTIQFGEETSETLIRIYNKAVERGYEDRHWIRLELQLRNDNANEYIKHLNESEYTGFTAGDIFKMVVSNNLTFLVPGVDTNKSRWNTRPYWKKFIGDLPKIKLYSKKDQEYNLKKLRDTHHRNRFNNYVYNQLYGINGIIEDMCNMDQNELPHHYKTMLEQFGKLKPINELKKEDA